VLLGHGLHAVALLHIIFIESGNMMNWIELSRDTAWWRTKPPTSIKFLCENGYIKGNVLHSGIGLDKHGHKMLSQYATTLEKHDPNFCSNKKTFEREYDVVVQCYVLNVLPSDSQEFDQCLKQLAKNTKQACKCYVNVMNNNTLPDGEVCGKGVITSKNTYQETMSFESWRNVLLKHFANVQRVKGFYKVSRHYLFECSGKKD